MIKILSRLKNVTVIMESSISEVKMGEFNFLNSVTYFLFSLSFFLYDKEIMILKRVFDGVK